MTTLAGRLRLLIEEHGPLPVARFMALALAHPSQGYYARRDPLGRAGDFVTAPEISQLFGELLGLCLVQHWLDLGRPARVLLVELGPGRGTLMADALRAARTVPGFLPAISVHLVETSPALRERQAAALPGVGACWHDELRGVPTEAPILLVANEFLDAFPIRQFVRVGTRWHERLVAVDADGAFRFALSPRATPMAALAGPAAEDLPEGSLIELGPARTAVTEAIAQRLVAQGGLGLLIDYGAVAPLMLGDTLQAVRAHRKVDPLACPGECDLSAHVDFAALVGRARAAGAVVHGPVPQGVLLQRLGLPLRLRALAGRANPAQQAELAAGAARLCSPEQMGELFKALALTAPGAPVPPGFAAADEGRP